LSIEILVIIGLILFFSSVIQGIVGFAFNLFAIPLMIWAGLSLSEAISISAIPIFVQSLTATIKLKQYVLWKEVTIASIIRYVSIPIGIYILTLIESFDKNSIKQIVGLAILLVVLSQMFLKVEPKEKVGFFWTFTSFFVSGITLGMVSMGGPTAVLWTMAHKFDVKTSRAFLSALFLIASPFQIALLYYNFGDNLLNFFLIGLAFTPIVVLSTLFGIKLGNFLDRKMLKNIVMSLLVLTSLVSMFSPYF
jgi:uncharacterized membrane protein YfcA